MTTLPSILVADDDPMVRRVLVRVVERVAPNTPIVQATNGAEALAALPQHTWLAIITDYTMPEASGLDVVLAARAQDATVPIIVVSARAEVRGDVLAAGARWFLAKPFTLDQLMELVQAAITAR